jgi:hypothetical protein
VLFKSPFFESRSDPVFPPAAFTTCELTACLPSHAFARSHRQKSSPAKFSARPALLAHYQAKFRDWAMPPLIQIRASKRCSAQGNCVIVGGAQLIIIGNTKNVAASEIGTGP